MRLRTSPRDKLERELRQLEKRREELDTAIQDAERDASAAKLRTADLEDVEAKAFLGELTADEAARRRDEIDEDIRRAETRAAQLRRAVPELERRISAKRAELKAAKRAEQEERYREALRARNKRAETFREALNASDQARRALERERQRCDAEASALSPLLDEYEDMPEYGGDDEPDWRPAAWKTLVDVIEQGPRRPIAKTAAKLAELEEQQARGDEASIRWATGPGGSETLIQQLPERLQEEARRRLAARREADRERREAAERERREAPGFVRLDRSR